MILQVPNPGATSAETYRLKLDHPPDRTWMGRLQNGDHLLYMLTMEPHLRYEPGTGVVQALADLDAPNPLAADIRLAERTVARRPGTTSRGPAHRHGSPVMSRLRQMIMGRGL